MNPAALDADAHCAGRRGSRGRGSPRASPRQDWLGVELGVPARTVSRILRHHAMPHLGELDPLTGTVIRASKTTAFCYERDRPGELVHMDVKKIGRLPDGGGWRAHGRQMGLHRRHHAGPDRLRLRPLARRRPLPTRLPRSIPTNEARPPPAS